MEPTIKFFQVIRANSHMCMWEFARMTCENLIVLLERHEGICSSKFSHMWDMWESDRWNSPFIRANSHSENVLEWRSKNDRLARRSNSHTRAWKSARGCHHFWIVICSSGPGKEEIILKIFGSPDHYRNPSIKMTTRANDDPKTTNDHSGKWRSKIDDHSSKWRPKIEWSGNLLKCHRCWIVICSSGHSIRANWSF